jgi:hypothetical protein
MNCHDYRERVTVRLADGSEPPDDHGVSCPECARYAELARAAWEAAGRVADEPVPPALADKILRTGRRPRKADLTLLRPGPLAAAAILALGLFALFRWAASGKSDGPMLIDSDGMSVERYELPAGADAARTAEEIRREVAPEAWGEGGCGLEAGDGFLRVRATVEVQGAVRDYLGRARSRKPEAKPAKWKR